MNTKIQQSIIAGIAGTAVMSLVMFIAPMMGIPKMNPAALLSGMMGLPVIIGWVMHFMIGIIFAGTYVYLFNTNVHIQNKFIKGALFGFIVFVFAQLMMFIMGKMFSMPMAQDNMLMMMFGSMIGHLVYGVIISLIVPNDAVG